MNGCTMQRTNKKNHDIVYMYCGRTRKCEITKTMADGKFEMTRATQRAIR